MVSCSGNHGPFGIIKLVAADGGADGQASLPTVLREWGRIGCIGFGGPPAHIALLRKLCVDRRGWLDAAEFEDAIAACNLLPGPASTELAIFCAWRVRGRLGALVGGLAFIVPGLILILPLSVLFLAGTPPPWVRGAGAGAGAAVAAVAAQAGWPLLVPSWERARAEAGGAPGCAGPAACWRAGRPRPPSGPGWCWCCSDAAVWNWPRRRPARPRRRPADRAGDRAAGPGPR